MLHFAVGPNLKFSAKPNRPVMHGPPRAPVSNSLGQASPSISLVREDVYGGIIVKQWIQLASSDQSSWPSLAAAMQGGSSSVGHNPEYQDRCIADVKADTNDASFVTGTLSLREEKEENIMTVVSDDHETTCWGCGLRLLLSSYTPIFKCGWCGAITNPNTCKRESKCLQWRYLRDRSFVCILIIFMLFLICGGVLAVYPIIFSISYFYGIFHCTITLILSVATLSTFSLAAFCCAGRPPNVMWGNYPVVGKGSLENYTFCHYCSKPKSPRTHHCRSCRICILDMDHHCPFIGNCVGAANHRYFIAFLISSVLSTTYVAIMSVHAGIHIWPPLTYRSLDRLNLSGAALGFIVIKETIIAILSSAGHLSLRGLVLVYLFVSSVSVEIGLSVLLWQQLNFIYEGKTYLMHLSPQGDDAAGERDCRNLLRFFGCPYSASRYLTSFSNSIKRHKK